MRSTIRDAAELKKEALSSIPEPVSVKQIQKEFPALINALIHFLVSLLIVKRKTADKNLYYFITGLVFVFITMVIPVQLSGSWITLLWISEAALLFMIGRKGGDYFYEKLSYPLMVLAFLSMCLEWQVYSGSHLGSDPGVRFIPLLNIEFMGSALFTGIMGLIC